MKPLAVVAPTALAIALMGAFSRDAAANPRPFPFSYQYETSLEGALEVEQYVDVSPVKVARELPDGTLEGVTSLRSVLQTELEYGITDRLEFGWYFQFKQEASVDPHLTFDGIKQRLRLRLAEEGQWPVNVGLYYEMAELHDEIEFEEKILLSRRFGPVNLVANLWVEQEYKFQDDEWEHLYNPTAGIGYELNPTFSVGLEYWGRGEFAEEFSESKHYLGPTFLAQTGAGWMTVGAYLRMDHLSRAPAVDDPYGRLWFRALIGIDL